ncbi:MAG: hypothetical protein Q9184_003799 [Pyrenodesmia sp. 2 TL-2023]
MTLIELLYIFAIIIAQKYNRYHYDQEQSQTEGWDFTDRKLWIRHAIRQLEDQIDADAGANAGDAVCLDSDIPISARVKRVLLYYV